MSTEKKMELAVSIINSVVANSSANFDTRLEKAPQYLEAIYNKIDELSNSSSESIDNSNNDDEPITVI